MPGFSINQIRFVLAVVGVSGHHASDSQRLGGFNGNQMPTSFLSAVE
jgi:hypothetical protein